MCVDFLSLSPLLFMLHTTDSRRDCSVYYDESDGATWTQCSDVVRVSNYTPPSQYRSCPGTSAAHRASATSSLLAALGVLLALSAAEAWAA